MSSWKQKLANAQVFMLISAFVSSETTQFYAAEVARSNRKGEVDTHIRLLAWRFDGKKKKTAISTSSVLINIFYLLNMYNTCTSLHFIFLKRAFQDLFSPRRRESLLRLI